ncbi:MAG: tRNA (adenosine(37)-N6)-dimethylallyltransferase MiaA [Candidatus Omnitrophica bacterium]|nr:tRNA (adenosine(37)-N6)-dimethylallyltransferase MiaA [Candidatus Omnitrophota bacterium]
MTEKKPLIVFILGPTGTGKSDIAVRLAKKAGGEIISCDSMQVYKGMRIISQQPPAKLLHTVAHHLISMIDPDREWSAADFIDKARLAARRIVKRKGIPIVVGGTGLYARSLIKGLFLSPPKDDRLRRSLLRRSERFGRKKLYERLRVIDPVYAKRIHQNDLRRIVRALEVYKLTGKPISEKQRERAGIEDEYDVRIFIVNREREKLYERIDERVENMFNAGIINEVKRLRKRRISKTAKAALGYSEISDHINGKWALDETKELIKKHTRRYAKRQLTWFRREEGAGWFDLTTKKSETVLVNKLAKEIKRGERDGFPGYSKG